MEADCGVETVFSVEVLFVVEECDSFSYPGIYVVGVEAKGFVVDGKGGTYVVGLGDTFVSH